MVSHCVYRGQRDKNSSQSSVLATFTVDFGHLCTFCGQVAVLKKQGVLGQQLS